LNFPVTIYNMALEMISRGDASLMNIVGLQDIAVTIERFADERTKQEYLPRFCSGEVTGAMVLTEPEAGSDLQAVQLKATEDTQAGCWRLNGVKRFITNGCGDVLLVLARSEEGTKGAKGLSLFLYERDDTIKVRRLEDKLGIRGSPTCELQFRNSPARLIGKRRFGLIRYVMSLMNGARLGVAVQALGIAEAAYHEALKYAREREQFGKKIIEFPAVYDMLSTMRMDIELTRSLILATSKAVDMEEALERRVARGDTSLKERHKHYSRLASALTPISKYYASEMANRVTTTAIQVHGGPGYMRDFNVERHFRDARITNIYEGTSQLQVVAAIGPVLTGVMGEEFSRLSQGPWGEHEVLAARLSSCRELYEGALAFVREKRDSEYTDYHARRLVDMAAEIYMGHLILGEARLSQRKALLAQKYISDLLPRVRMNAEQVSCGDRSVIDHRSEILGTDSRK
ncbi:MAG: acyl-CoA dehydrogenase family protein, partial [Nitrospinota bacterium]